MLQSHQWAHIRVSCVQKEVTAVLLEGDKGGQQLEGVAMKGTIAKRFEELDWDNNGMALQTLLSCFYLFQCAPFCPVS